MPVFQKPITVKQISEETGFKEPVVREVVRSLERHGIVTREDVGERIFSATQSGLVSTATPLSEYHADVDVDVAPEYVQQEDAGDTKG